MSPSSTRNPERVAEFAIIVLPRLLQHIKGLSIRAGGYWEPDNYFLRLVPQLPRLVGLALSYSSDSCDVVTSVLEQVGKQIQELQVIVLNSRAGHFLSDLLSLCPFLRHLDVQFRIEEDDRPRGAPPGCWSASLAATLGSLAALKTLALTGEPSDVLDAITEQATWAPELTHLKLSSIYSDDPDTDALAIDSPLGFLQHVAPTLTSFSTDRSLGASTDLRLPSARFSTPFLPRIRVFHLGHYVKRRTKRCETSSFAIGRRSRTSGRT